MRFAVLIVICLIGLGGCGQKGPLYLPEPEKNQEETR